MIGKNMKSALGIAWRPNCRVSDSRARGPGFETKLHHVVSEPSSAFEKWSGHVISIKDVLESWGRAQKGTFSLS